MFIFFLYKLGQTFFLGKQLGLCPAASFIDQIIVTSSINKDSIKLDGSSTQTVGSDPVSLAKQSATTLASLLQELNSHLEKSRSLHINVFKHRRRRR
jgi:hypothetical protein